MLNEFLFLSETRPFPNLGNIFENTSNHFLTQRQCTRTGSLQRMLNISWEKYHSAKSTILNVLKTKPQSSKLSIFGKSTISEEIKNWHEWIINNKSASWLDWQIIAENLDNPNTQEDLTFLKNAIESGELNQAYLRDKLQGAMYDLDSDTYTKLIDICSTSAGYGLLGVFHGHFNKVFSVWAETKEGGLKYQSLSDMSNDFEIIYQEAKSWMEDFDKFLSHAQKELFSSIIYKDSKDAIKKCLTLVERMEESIADWANKNAILKIITNHLLRLGKNGQAERFGQISAKAGRITREAMNSVVSAFKLALHLELNPQDSVLDNVWKNVDKCPFDAPLPDGKYIEISKLAQQDEGSFVEIRGFVKNIEVYRAASDNKLVSKVLLYDPSNGSEVYAAAIYVHLEHIGLTQGSYCTLHGKLSHNSILTNGERTIQINNLAIASELVKNSWRMAFLHFSKDLYETWKNGLQIDIAIAEHEASTALKMGAGELMFPPFLFSQEEIKNYKEQQQTFNKFRDRVENKMRHEIFTLQKSSHYLKKIEYQSDKKQKNTLLHNALKYLLFSCVYAKTSQGNIELLRKIYEN